MLLRPSQGYWCYRSGGKRLWTNTWWYFEKSCFPKADLVYKTFFFLVPLDEEFNLNKIVWLLSWTMQPSRLFRIKSYNRKGLSQKRFFQYFHNFYFKSFSSQISLLKLWNIHQKISDFTENISVYLQLQENCYQNFVIIFSCFDRRSWTIE